MLTASLLFIVAMALLVGLGTWQFQRGLEKADIDRKLQKGEKVIQLGHAPENWSSLDYQQASLSGDWLTDRAFLLENRIYQGVPGYEVLVPFRLSGGDTIMLVNRGWISGEAADGLDLSGSGKRGPAGVLYQPEPGFTLGDTVSGERTWPQPILYLDIPALSRRLELALEPAILVLNSDHVDSFQQLWRPTSIPASRHFGYAVQWWGLALTLLIFGVIWRRRANNRSNL